MKNYLLLALTAIIVCSCGSTTGITLDSQYPKMYAEKPTSIVIMPPINQTNFVEAKDYFYTTLHAPLCEKGYYVFSPMLTMEMFQSESAYDAERFLEGDLSQFRNVLGADAAMFTIIKTWSRNNLAGSLTADVEYRLRSTKTGETLYQREGRITVDTSVTNSTGGGLLGALAGLAANALATATTDKVVAGRKCTAYVLSDLPQGRYGTLFDKDQKNAAGSPMVTATVR